MKASPDHQERFGTLGQSRVDTAMWATARATSDHCPFGSWSRWATREPAGRRVTLCKVQAALVGRLRHVILCRRRQTPTLLAELPLDVSGRQNRFQDSSPGGAADGVAGLLFEEAGGASGDGEAGDGFVFGGELFAGGALKCGAVVGVGEGGFQSVELVLLLCRAGEAGSFGVVPPGSCFG